MGTRYDQVNGKVEQQPDGFKGANPVFVLDDDKPQRLTFVWAPAKWAKDIGAPINAEEATIVSFTSDKITAIAVEQESAVVKMFSIYPGNGLVYFTQHRYIMGSIPNSSSFYAICTVSAK